ncbi:substrate-binding domain-containing protein [Azotobacter salinestris]|uniref:substrate-binding domain-containing protein n=1 Tax=Azotobacter salinestris TaxID=69964 RepID=UPI0032DEEBD7
MGRWLSFRIFLAVSLFCGLLFTYPTVAEPLQFALLAKRIDQRFFIQAGEGCAEAARAQGDVCRLLGTSGPPHFRKQNQLLEQAFHQKLDGIALSVTQSEWLAEHALKQRGHIPLITFNTDFNPAEQQLRRSHVGFDNLVFGKQLGRLAQRLRPQGGRLCVLTGSLRDTHQQERLHGIRLQLGAIPNHKGTERLRGENGWFEPSRCPLERAETADRALLQLATLLNTNQFDVIVHIGSWPIDQPAMYRQQLGPILTELDRQGTRPAIIIATPDPDAEQSALLDDGLVQAYLGWSSHELGRQSYWILKRLAQGQAVPEKVLIDTFNIYLPQASSNSPAKP